MSLSLGKLSRGAGRYLPIRPFRMRNSGPLASFTFDDVPESSFVHGAGVLERHGLLGTFYIAFGQCGRENEQEHWALIKREQVAELHHRGHEIGCHTYSHVKVQHLSAIGLSEELRRNRSESMDICNDMVLSNFAYPYGVVSLNRKLQLQKHFTSCRGIYPGINRGIIDLALLSAHELYDRTCAEQSIETAIGEAVATNGWIIFYTHDVAPNPSWIGCSPNLLDKTICAAKRRGLACVTIREGLERIGAVRTLT